MLVIVVARAPRSVWLLAARLAMRRSCERGCRRRRRRLAGRFNGRLKFRLLDGPISKCRTQLECS